MPQEEAAKPAETVSKVLKSHLDKIFDSQSVEEYHQSYVKKQGQSSLACTAIVAELNVVLKLESKKAALDSLVDADPTLQGLSSRSFLSSSC